MSHLQSAECDMECETYTRIMKLLVHDDEGGHGHTPVRLAIEQLRRLAATLRMSAAPRET